MSDLIRRLSHELLGWLSPDSWHSDHPANVIVDYLSGGLVGQLLQAMVFEEPQRMREDLQGQHLPSIRCLDLHAFVQILYREVGISSDAITIIIVDSVELPVATERGQ